MRKNKREREREREGEMFKTNAEEAKKRIATVWDEHRIQYPSKLIRPETELELLTHDKGVLATCEIVLKLFW